MREITPKSFDGLILPDTSQRIDLKEYNVLEFVPPPHKHHGKMIWVPPGLTNESMKARPFHVYDPEFLPIIGLYPTMTLIAETDVDPLFHEATAWYPPTDEFFFAQNAGAKAAGTGMAKSAIVQKIDLQQAERIRLEDKGEKIQIDVVSDGSEGIVNPNGATNWNGQIVFCAEGQGDEITTGLVLMNPLEPHNTTVLLNNYHGRQFNSLNDVVTNPRNHELYFTDTVYGHLQDFRPKPGLRSQVYRFDSKSGQVRAVADGFDKPNGIAFSPSGRHAYIADTGISGGFYGNDYTAPATIYRFDVAQDGTWSNRQLFAYISVGSPDGIHCDDKGNVYAGIGDGVAVWNPSGKLIGKIFVGGVVANFQFAGRGRMIILAETHLWYVTLRAKGAEIHDL
ncbi:evolved D-pantonohydrolase [Naematelia encephala]|uniref:Evolved D-pantonohydrolase n=1 Tax=Naematelia encephala TaxID=71784 RepID=A0A1Y2ANC1_9TREE|nr:evolved D-pantonohydrolase [Naematelia encephala]